jgi:hypothetical protein
MLLARVGRFVTTSLRHAVPLGGVFGRDWHAATAIGVYWLESVLLVLATAFLCALMRRRAPPAEISAAGIEPRDVLIFHLGSLLVFGGFLGGVLLILIGNGRIAEPLQWDELRTGAEAMLVVVGLGFLFDLWRFDAFTVAAVRARVDACLTRWALFWLLGFFGTWFMVVTGRAAIFFGFFGALKITFESWASLARWFGWRSLKDRASEV